MEFNLGQLESLFEDIKEIIGYFEASQMEKKVTTIYLSNGERLNYRVTKESIAHLLGINTTYLISTGRFNSKNSFELIKELVEYPFRVNDLHKQGIISYDHLFSPYIYNKIETFNNNIKINIFETEFICKYDPQKVHLSGEDAQKCDYVLVKKRPDSEVYNVLYLVKNTAPNGYYYYAPMSNQTFSDFDSLRNNLSKILKNQELTLINSIQIKSSDEFVEPKKITLPFEIRASKLNNLNKNYKQNFECYIDVTAELIHYLNEYQKTIDISREDVDIHALRKELEELRHQLLSATSERTSLVSEIETLKTEKAILLEQNKNHEELKTKIYQMVKPSN